MKSLRRDRDLFFHIYLKLNVFSKLKTFDYKVYEIRAIKEDCPNDLHEIPIILPEKFISIFLKNNYFFLEVESTVK